MKTFKTCNRCGESLPLDCFPLVYYKSRGKHYRRGHCRACGNRACRAYYEKNRPNILRQKRIKYALDPWKARQQALLRRCAAGYVSVEALKTLVREAGGRCHYCGAYFGDAWTFDHASPINKGGTNDPSNLVVCCLSCNSRKQDKSEDDYLYETTGVPF